MEDPVALLRRLLAQLASRAKQKVLDASAEAVQLAIDAGVAISFPPPPPEQRRRSRSASSTPKHSTGNGRFETTGGQYGSPSHNERHMFPRDPLGSDVPPEDGAALEAERELFCILPHLYATVNEVLLEYLRWRRKLDDGQTDLRIGDDIQNAETAFLVEQTENVRRRAVIAMRACRVVSKSINGYRPHLSLMLQKPLVDSGLVNSACKLLLMERDSDDPLVSLAVTALLKRCTRHHSGGLHAIDAMYAVANETTWVDVLLRWAEMDRPSCKSVAWNMVVAFSDDQSGNHFNFDEIVDWTGPPRTELIDKLKRVTALLVQALTLRSRAPACLRMQERLLEAVSTVFLNPEMPSLLVDAHIHDRIAAIGRDKTRSSRLRAVALDSLSNVVFFPDLESRLISRMVPRAAMRLLRLYPLHPPGSTAGIAAKGASGVASGNGYEGDIDCDGDGDSEDADSDWGGDAHDNENGSSDADSDIFMPVASAFYSSDWVQIESNGLADQSTARILDGDLNRFADLFTRVSIHDVGNDSSNDGSNVNDGSNDGGSNNVSEPISCDSTAPHLQGTGVSPSELCASPSHTAPSAQCPAMHPSTCVPANPTHPHSHQPALSDVPNGYPAHTSGSILVGAPDGLSIEQDDDHTCKTPASPATHSGGNGHLAADTSDGAAPGSLLGTADREALSDGASAFFKDNSGQMGSASSGESIGESIGQGTGQTSGESDGQGNANGGALNSQEASEDIWMDDIVGSSSHSAKWSDLDMWSPTAPLAEKHAYGVMWLMRNFVTGIQAAKIQLVSIRSFPHLVRLVADSTFEDVSNALVIVGELGCDKLTLQALGDAGMIEALAQCLPRIFLPLRKATTRFGGYHPTPTPGSGGGGGWAFDAVGEEDDAGDSSTTSEGSNSSNSEESGDDNSAEVMHGEHMQEAVLALTTTLGLLMSIAEVSKVLCERVRVSRGLQICLGLYQSVPKRFKRRPYAVRPRVREFVQRCAADEGRQYVVDMMLSINVVRALVFPLSHRRRVDRAVRLLGDWVALRVLYNPHHPIGRRRIIAEYQELCAEYGRHVPDDPVEDEAGQPGHGAGAEGQ